MKSPDAELQALIDQLVAEGHERGIQLAVYFRGELALNIHAGTMSPGGAPVTGDTLFPVFSVSKGITATIIHRLVERGLFSYDTRIAEFWPEFGANGKDRITLRQALDHTCGLPLMPRNVGLADLPDWETMCRAVAGLKPVWEPGTRYEYHPVTFAWILGEFMQRADGRSLPKMLAEEVCVPLGVENSLFIGMPESESGRVAVLEDATDDEPAPDDGTPKAVPGWLTPLHRLMNRPDAQRACIPATSGIMSAEAMARHYAALLPGGVSGVELLTPARVAEIIGSEPPVEEDSRRLGYQVKPASGGGVTVGHNGYGGSTAYADVVHGFSLGLTRNRFDEETHGQVLEMARKIFVAKATA